MNTFDFFDKIYYINLDSRKDRLIHVTKQLELAGISKAKRQEGVVSIHFEDKKLNAARGNHISHALCLIDAHENRAENCLILEDDVEFFYPKEELNDLLNKSILQLPKNWGLFYLGINMDQYFAYRVSDNLAKLEGGFSTHAYAINKNLFNRLILENLREDLIHNDVFYSNVIMKEYPCYVTIPLLAGQLTNYSDIEDRVVDSNDMFKQRFKDRLI